MNEFIVSTGSGNKVISSDDGQRGKSRKGSRKGISVYSGNKYLDALKEWLEMNTDYNGSGSYYDSNTGVSFDDEMTEEAAYEQLANIAWKDRKSVDTLLREMH